MPFLVQSADQFRTAGPYPLTSAAYAADVNEVEALGAINSATRTPEQSHIAAVSGRSNPSPGYNALGRRFVDQLSLSTRDSALLFAMIDLNAADAIINTWNDKYHWTSGGRSRRSGTPTPTATRTRSGRQLDAAVRSVAAASIGGVGPALITPPYPGSPVRPYDGHERDDDAFGSFFGTNDMTFYPHEQPLPRRAALLQPLLRLTDQVIEARIWAGIHFRNADANAKARPRRRGLHARDAVRLRAISAWRGRRVARRRLDRPKQHFSCQERVGLRPASSSRRANPDGAAAVERRELQPATSGVTGPAESV